MGNTDYRIRIKIGAQDVEIEAQGDKEFVSGIFTEFQEKGAEIIPKHALTSVKEEREGEKAPKGKELKLEKAKLLSKKVPARVPKFLQERRATIAKFMSDPIPTDPPYKVAVQKASNLEQQCALTLTLFRERYEVLGLSASELERILVKRFSVSTTAETIRKKLKKWPTHIDSVSHPRHTRLTLYQLTPAGYEDMKNALEVQSGRFQAKSLEDMMPEGP